jgi:hypothetical protein
MSEKKEQSGNGTVPAAIILVLAVLAGLYGGFKIKDVLATFLMPFGVIAVGVIVWLWVRNTRKSQSA